MENSLNQTQQSSTHIAGSLATVPLFLLPFESIRWTISELILFVAALNGYIRDAVWLVTLVNPTQHAKKGQSSFAENMNSMEMRAKRNK